MSFRRHLLKRMKGEKELPYIQLDYIESTGTQYIDTGINPDQNTKVECVANWAFSVSSSNRNPTLYGARSNTSSFYEVLQGVGNMIYYQYGSTSPNITGTTIFGNKVKYLTDSNKFYINDTLKITAKDSTFTNNQSIYIFGLNNQGTVGRFSLAKIYDFKIYENGNLVMDLIPCIRKTDGVVCMYDLVSNSFFENEGTGSFIPGTLTNLPEGYAQVSYLESTGTQYIDTGFIPTNKTKSIVDMQCTNWTTMRANFFGAGDYTRDARFNLGMNTAKTFFQWNIADKYFESIIARTTNRITITMDAINKSITFGTETIVKDTPNYDLINNGTFTFWLFSTNGAYNSYCKIFSCKIYDDNKLILNMIPCLDDEGVPCMYDILNNKCYYNEGTGDFLYGEIIKRTGFPKGYQELEYLESTGVQYIDIGLKVSNKTKVELVGKQYVASSSLFGVNPLFVITSVQSTDKKQLCRFRYNNTSQDTDVNILELSKITFDKNKGYINDVLLATFTEATFSSNYNAILFGRRINSSGALEELTQQRIDYFKMWENDVLVRDMIPCLDENGRPCMYDMVNYKTYYNLGEGEFLYGIKEPTKNLIKETNLGFPAGGSTSISINSTYPYSYYMNDILLEKGKTYEVNVTYARVPSTTDDGTIRFRMLNEDGTFWGAPSSGTYTSFFESIDLIGKVGSSAISQWFSFQKAILKPLKNCYMRPLVILGTKAKTPPCAYFVDIKEV